MDIERYTTTFMPINASIDSLVRQSEVLCMRHFFVECMYPLLDFFFFFQAEDGIRDWSVTGVQTCALPIWEMRADSMLYRMPLDGSEPSALGVSGSQVDQFSFLESEDNHLNVLLRSDLFLRNDGLHFEEAGELAARSDRAVDDACRASCVDWYGNARPLFFGGRVLALLGYEIVEGKVDDGRTRELRRVSYAPHRMEITSR